MPISDATIRDVIARRGLCEPTIERPTSIQNSEAILAVRGRKLEEVFEPFLLKLEGYDPVPGGQVSGGGVSIEAFVKWKIHKADFRLHRRIVAVDDLVVLVTPSLRLTVDFDRMYDSLTSHGVPLPPRCIKYYWCEVWWPIPRRCSWKYKCINLPRVGPFTVEPPLPAPIDFAGLYDVCHNEAEGNKYVVFPALIYRDPTRGGIIDYGTLMEITCKAIMTHLPSDLRGAAGWICNNLATLVSGIDTLYDSMQNNIAAWLFEKTGGWVTIKIEALKLYELDRGRIPGTDIPVQLNNLRAGINPSDELQLRVSVEPSL